MSIAQNFPEIKPSLNLDFANVKKLDPRVAFARASTARYYDGVTTAKAEENLILRSQEFDNASWIKANATATANSSTSPDGTTTAELITASAGTAVHYVQQNFTAVIGQVYTVSIYAKAGTNSFIQFAFGADAPVANFDISTGVVGTTTSVTSATITSAGNNWYRCVVVYTAAAASTSFVISLVPSSSSARIPSWAAVGTETVELWGAQLEQRSSVTAYTPTTTQPITNYIPVLQTAANNVARFDHDPVTGESLGLLVEEQRTNLLTYSSEFDNGVWIKTRASVTSNTIVAPDGTLTGDKLVEDTSASSTHFIEGQRAGSIGDFTWSCFVKAAERTNVRVAIFSSNVNAHASFDLVAGTVGSLSSVLSASITPVGNGWYRCSVSANQPDTRTLQLRVHLIDSGTNITYTGDGYSGIYIWGAQLEAGAFPTSYIPTVASQVTRSADSASMTGANFSEWYRQDEGTVYLKGTNFHNYSGSPYPRYIEIKGDGSRNTIEVLAFNGDMHTSVFYDNSLQFNLSVDYADVNVVAMSYERNNTVAVVNGNTSSVDTSCLIPSVNRLNIAGVGFNGHFRKLSYYPQALSATNLQALTGS